MTRKGLFLSALFTLGTALFLGLSAEWVDFTTRHYKGSNLGCAVFITPYVIGFFLILIMARVLGY